MLLAVRVNCSIANKKSRETNAKILLENRLEYPRRVFDTSIVLLLDLFLLTLEDGKIGERVGRWNRVPLGMPF